MLKDGFFKTWLDKITVRDEDYCKIDALFSRELDRMVALEPREPNNLQFYDEAISHLQNHRQFLDDWRHLKQTTLDLNGERALLFEDIRLRLKKEIDLQYWCPIYLSPHYSGDEPEEYLCSARVPSMIH